MKSRDLFLAFILGIVGMFIAVFFLIKNKELFMLVPTAVARGEIWRFLSYHLIHKNLNHLIENCIGFFFVGFIAYELKVGLKRYILAYIIAAIFAVLPIWVVFRFIAFGASAAVLALFSFSSINLTRLGISLVVVYFLLLGLIVIGSSGEYSFLGHLAGFGFGFLIYGIFSLFDKRKQKILRRCDENA